jgi:transcriptional regulator with XRE-family HTH domain
MEQRLKRNAVGAEIRKMRDARRLTQEMLVARCYLAGCNISRGTLAKVESQIRGCSDVELFTIAKVLGVRMDELFPKGFAATLKASAAARPA